MCVCVLGLRVEKRRRRRDEIVRERESRERKRRSFETVVWRFLLLLGEEKGKKKSWAGFGPILELWPIACTRIRGFNTSACRLYVGLRPKQ